MSNDVIWLGLTEAQLEAGLIERGHVTVNVLTGERNKRVTPGSVERIRDLSAALRPAFASWWKTGKITDVAESGGTCLKDLIDGEEGRIKHSIIGAFLGLDWIIREPSVRHMVTRGAHDSIIHSKSGQV